MEKKEKSIKYSFKKFNLDLSKCEQCGSKYTMSMIDYL